VTKQPSVGFCFSKLCGSDWSVPAFCSVQINMSNSNNRVIGIGIELIRAEWRPGDLLGWERPPVDVCAGPIMSVERVPFPVSVATEQADITDPQIIYHVRYQIPVMIPAHYEDWNSGIIEPDHFSLKDTISLDILILLVDDVASHDDCIRFSVDC
jgi:hypothetical protein